MARLTRALLAVVGAAALNAPFGVRPAPARPLRPAANTVIFARGTLHDLYPSGTSMVAHARALANSGFDTVVVGNLHYSPPRSMPRAVPAMWYNDVPMYRAKATLLEAVAELKAPGTSRAQRILLSIGGAGREGDLYFIHEHWDAFVRAFTHLLVDSGFDGFDVNLVGNVQHFQPSLVLLADLAAELGVYMTITTPTYDPVWVRFMADTTVNGEPIVSWINFQNPLWSGARDYALFVEALRTAFPHVTYNMVYPAHHTMFAPSARDMYDAVAAALHTYPSINGAVMLDYITAVTVNGSSSMQEYARASKLALLGI